MDTNLFGLLSNFGAGGATRTGGAPVEGGGLAFPYLPRSVFLSTG